MDDLLHLVQSDGADRLVLNVGSPPIVVLDGQPQPLEGPELSSENMEALLLSVADSRQRRELRNSGHLQFVFRFRGVTDFVVCARVREDLLVIEVY